MTTPTTRTARSASLTSPWTEMLPIEIEFGDRSKASANRGTWVTMVPDVLRSPPAVTATAGWAPWPCRNQIWNPAPPTTGMTRVGGADSRQPPNVARPACAPSWARFPEALPTLHGAS